ncbi:MAG: phenylacetate--CoA ligase family protein [Hyphomicrobiales bacterium]|nr:phenylacetate--CoA ligase family protein [Hyphomicrobiales bacterium]
MGEFQKQIYEMLMESQFWPPDQMLAFQRSQLSQLLHHAHNQVPFYKKRLFSVIRSNGDIDWKRWHEIPIVKRHHLVADRDSMMANKLPKGHGPTWDEYSSGSSGIPITTRHNLLQGWVSEASLYRAHRWHNMNWSRNSVSWRGQNEQAASWPEGQENETWAPIWLETSDRGRKFSINRFTSEERVIEFALRKNAMYLTGRPKSLQALALTADQSKIAINLDAVTTYGSEITEDEREDCHRIFGAKVLSLYSSGEGCKIANSCETGHHYHINSELNYLEILDDEGLPCAIGQPGRVIITPLFNTAQPLIRYEQGDIAIRGAACTCGRGLPVLQEVSGRISHLFRFPDGRKIAPSLPDKEFNVRFGAKTWQLVQIGPLEVELRYVQTDPDFVPNRDYALDVIHQRIRSDLVVKFTALTETPLTETGKFLRYKSELENST